MGDEIDLEISGTYAWQDTDPGKLTGCTSQHILPFVGPVRHLSGSTKSNSLPAQRNIFHGIQEWSDVVAAPPQNAMWESIELQIFGDSRRVSIFAYPLRKEVSLTIGTNSAESAEARKLLEELTSVLTLMPTNAVKALEGEARRYFIEDAIDENWFVKLRDVVQTFILPQASFRGDYWIGDQKSSKGDLDSWWNEVRSHWNEVRTLYCWCWLPHSATTVDIDLIRQTLKLELQRPTPAVLREDRLRAETRLNLKQFEGNPYQYRKYARLFRIDDWKGDAPLVESLRKAIGNAFPGRGPVLVNAYVKQGEKAEDLHSFSSLESFFARLEEGTPYKSAHLRVDGPKGSGVGIAVDRSKDRIAVRSSLDRDRFLRFLDDLQHRLDLTAIKIEGEDENEGSKPEKKSLREVSIPVGGVVLSAVIALTASLLTAGLPSLKTTLKVTVPAVSADGSAHVLGTSSPVRWTISRRTIRQGEIPVDSTAKLTLERADGQGTKTEQTGARPGARVNFPDSGSFYLTVHAEQIVDAPDETIRVEVSATNAKTKEIKRGK